jgi:Rieske Fe-S protein
MCEHVCGGTCGDAALEARGSVGSEMGGDAVAGLDRRELLKRGGLAAAALLLAACGVGTSDAITGPPSGGTVTVKLSDYPALASSGGVALVSGVAVENNNGSYIALSLRCPHQGGQILQSGSGFRCTVHGATFDHTGNWIGGQPTTNMYRVRVTDNGNGTLTLG